jgi:hypothetical protein
LALETVKQSSRYADDLLQHRDGTSQAARLLRALDPQYILVDERSLEDLLAFVREYAKELIYFDIENDALQPITDWSDFLNSDIQLDKVIAFMENPESFSTEQARDFKRPHFVLLLSFLQLLRLVQDQLNSLTQRHLDFYYQEVLQLAKKASIPDQVNLLVDLTSDTEQFLLPAGTLLNAGVDGEGQDLLYRTDGDIVVNHAQVARQSSVFAEKKVTGIREAREKHSGTDQEAFMEMLKIALGDPQPGDELPAYETFDGQKLPISYEFLFSGEESSLDGLLRFIKTGLWMDFAELRLLKRLKDQRDQSGPEWDQINALLEKAAKAREPDILWKVDNPRDFDNNLKAAMGGTLNFAGITEVKNIYELYDQRIRESVQQFIRDHLFFEEVNDFYSLMQIKVRIDNQWVEINRILTKAGQEKGTLAKDAKLPYAPRKNEPKDDQAFEINLTTALGGVISEIGTFDDYYAELMAAEKYFHLSMENISFLLSVEKDENSSSSEWDKVYTLLADAHKKKVYARRKETLSQIHRTDGLEAMIEFALGTDPAVEGTATLDELLDNLLDYVPNTDDAAILTSHPKTAKSQPKVWEQIYQIVEKAQRIRQNLPEPLAQKEEWLNLYAAADATEIEAGLGIETDNENPRWKTFGQGYPRVNIEEKPATTFGWAFTSPLLSLDQGERTITLTLGFDAQEFVHQDINELFSEDKPNPFVIQISGEKGWLEPDTIDARVIAPETQKSQTKEKDSHDYFSTLGIEAPKGEKLSAIQFVLRFDANSDAITPLPEEEGQIKTPWPLLRLSLRQKWQPSKTNPNIGRYTTDYKPFKGLHLTRTHIQVSVSGLSPLQIQNDDTALDSKKPFEPFGTRPQAGARFFIGHPELSSKKLDELAFQFEWMAAPEDLVAHYQTYLDLDENNFTVKVSLLDRQLEVPLMSAAPLFGDLTHASQPQKISIENIPQAIEQSRPGYVYARIKELIDAEDLLNWNRYIQWELNAPDFQFDTYPAIAAQKSVALAADVANNVSISAADYQVNPPYTPKVKKFSVDYSASLEIILSAYQPGSQRDRILHIQPFGHHEVQAQSPEGKFSFLPQFDFEGQLYIGIQDVSPPQNLSLLFQMAEGSADPDLDPEPIQWSYLSGDQWLSLNEGHILDDTTRGLINSGIITFELGESKLSSSLPPEFVWLRAAIPKNTSSVCDTVAIHAQAVSATFLDQDNAADHLSKPLPPQSINELGVSIPEVLGIRQPYTSHGGKEAEGEAMFYTRISERLRHKQRALTVWDYEHIILNRFPQIYKAKCLPANPDQLGQVEITVIPDIKKKLPFNPFEPKAPSDLLADIETHLSDKVPAFATIKVKNAHYVPVKVRIATRFKPGHNEGYYQQAVQDELNRFLSPWAYEEGADIIIGGKIYANSIINFLEDRPYIDYVTDIKLFSSEDGTSFQYIQPSDSGDYWVETPRSDGVLVAAQQHEIDIISETGYEEESFEGINYMKIELDFMVHEDQ